MVITHENPSPGDPIDHHLEWDMLKPGPVFVTQRNETITRSRECSDPVHAWVSEAEGCDWSVMSQLPSDWLGLICALLGTVTCIRGQWRCEHGGDFTALLVYCPSRQSSRQGSQLGALSSDTRWCSHAPRQTVSLSPPRSRIKFKPIISIVYLHCFEPTWKFFQQLLLTQLVAPPVGGHLTRSHFRK